MLTRRGAAVTALIIAAGFGASAPAFADTPATTLHVNNAQGVNCSDSGTGTQAQPYCTIQAAVNAVSAGQTVLIEPGIYNESITITHSGTPTAPITIKGNSARGPVDVTGGVDNVTVSGASDVVISGLDTKNATGASFLIDDSHDVTVSDNLLNFRMAGLTTQQIHVTGASTGVNIVKNTFDGTTESAIVIDGGGSGDLISTNLIQWVRGTGISVDSVTGVDIVSNTVDGTCDSGIAVTGSSTNATIENNVVSGVGSAPVKCSAPTTPVRGIVVSAGSVSGTVENYNDVNTDPATLPNYQWSGTDYFAAADLNAATGQGTTDSNAQVLDSEFRDQPMEKSPAIDSADASAPGEQSTDVQGFARQDDPLVSNAGIGSSTYYDRGAVERQDQLSFAQYPLTTNSVGNQVSQAPIGAPLTFTSKVTSSWGATVSYAYDFGDGPSPVTSTTGIATHSYAAAGTYEVNVNMTSNLGGQTDYGFGLTIVAGVPSPVLKVTPTGDMSVSVDPSQSTDPWQIYGAAIDFGDGTNAPNVDLTKPISHTYLYTGTFTITLTLEDSGGIDARATPTYTTNGSDFTAYGPARVLDTRKGLGTGGVVAAVGPGKSIQMKIGGTGTIPADATAVALNLTETGPTSDGDVVAYPTGSAFPPTSNLNYVKGQTKAANVVVALGTGGAVTLTNTSNGTVHLVADVTGYFTKSYGAGLDPIAPTRVLDTRKGTGLPGGKPAKVGAGQTIVVNVGGPSASAVVLNLTATDTVGGGYITAYADGAGKPVASSLNFAPGTTIANTVILPVGADGKVDFYNGSGGTVDLVADVESYFYPGVGATFVPTTPTRIYDSRNSTPLASAGTLTLMPWALDAQVPAHGVAAYVYNVTVTQPAVGGYLTVYPTGLPRPTVSNLNFAAGETTSNTAIATAGAGTQDNGAGANDFYNGAGGSLQLITDLFGYFASK